MENKTCLTCKKFVNCTNKNKRYDFVCSKYVSKLITNISLDDFGEKQSSIDKFKFDPDKQEDFDIFSLIDSMVGQDNVLPRDIKIDDSDIPQAPNFFEFAVDPRFLNVTPFPKQVEVASNYFNEICWKCSNREWKKGFPTQCTVEDIRENIQFFDKGVCPKCGRRKSVQIRKGKMRPYVQMAGLCGQRSGKSATFDMMEAYRLHWCLKTPKLAQFYGLLPSSQLHTSYVALTFGQAKETIYDTLYDYMTTSPWWQSYREMLDYYGNKYGEELYAIKDTFFRFRTQNITGYPAGPDRRKLRGRCLAGNVLVSTSKGLLKASDKNNLVGSKAVKGSNNPLIVGHTKQKYKKEVLRSYLFNGLVLDVTDDHRIPIFDIKNKEFKLKNCENILNDYVVCQLGGNFPKQLIFKHNILPYKPMYVDIAEWIDKRKSCFTIDDIVDELGYGRGGIYPHCLRYMVDSGALIKKKRWGFKGIPLPTLFKKSESWYLSDWNTLREGFINSNRKNITIPDKMSIELARLIGYLLADGWINGYTYSYCTTSKSKYSDFCKCFKKVFNCNLSKKIDSRNYGPNKDSNCYIAEFSYRSIIDFFKYLGVNGKTANCKEIPWCILQAPRDCVLNCISTMLSSDGALINRSDHVGFYYSSASVKMAKQFQQLMHKLGYYCNRRRGYVKVCRYDSVKFLKEYAGIQKRSYRKDAKIELTYSKHGYTRYLIPGTNVYTFSDINNFFKINVPKFLKKYIDKGYIFDKVIKQKSLGLKTVYDIEVDSKDHLFTANGVLVHNTRCSGAIDEIGWFLAAQAGTIKYDVDEIHKAMLNSFKTIHAATRKLYDQGYDNVLNPILANISSPSSVNDKIMRLYEQSKTSHYIYGFRYASWEFNPTLSEDDFIDEKINQPKEFMRDYMTIPPLSSNPFIEDVEQIGPCLTTNDNAFKLSTDKITTKSGRVMSSAKLFKNWVGKSNKILAIDAGLNNNSFALCLGHNEEVDIKGVKHLFPVYDCLSEAIPEKNCPINFNSMYNNVIAPIIEEYGVKMVVADRWNSAKVLDDIETDFGIEVETYSVKYQDFATFKEMLLNGQIKLPRCEGSYKNVSPDVTDYPFGFIAKPVQHFILQCITVQDFGDKSVTKGDGYTDDIFRATVLANSYLVDKDYKTRFVGDGVKRSGGGAIGSRGVDSISLSNNMGSRPTGYSTGSNSFISRG